MELSSDAFSDCVCVYVTGAVRSAANHSTRIRALSGQAVIQVETDRITLRLKCRKNKQHGSVLQRYCWCKGCKHTCPVHVLGPFFRSYSTGVPIFEDFTQASALQDLRELLAILGIADAGKYRCHDLRRGHARDMQASRSPLYKILEAGEWASAAFMTYLDRVKLEADAVLSAAEGDESDEELP